MSRGWYIVIMAFSEINRKYSFHKNYTWTHECKLRRNQFKDHEKFWHFQWYWKICKKVSFYKIEFCTRNLYWNASVPMTNLTYILISFSNNSWILINHFENMCEEQKPKINQDKAKKKKKQYREWCLRLQCFRRFDVDSQINKESETVRGKDLSDMNDWKSVPL